MKEPPIGVFELPVIQSNGAPPAWTDLDVEPPPAGRTMAVADLFLANVGGTLLAYRNACGWCRARLDDAPMAAGRHAHVPVVRAALRAAARGPLARRRPAPDPAGAAAARRRPRPRGGRLMDPALVSGLRRFVRPPAPPAPRAEAGRCELCPLSLPDDHKHLLDLEERRIVCVCADLLVDALGRRALPADRLAHAVARRRSSSRTSCGRSSRSRSAWRSSCARATSGKVVGLYPSPAGATECELDLEAWDRLVAANPVLEDLDPDAEALIVNRMAVAARPRDRPARRLLPARRDRQGDLGGDQRRRGDGGGRAALLRRPAGRGGRAMTLAAPTRSSSRSSAPSRSSTPRPRACASTCT